MQSLGTAFAQVQEREQAQAVWERAEAAARTIEVQGWHRNWALGDLGVALAKAQEWQRALALAETMEDNYHKAKILCEVAEVLATAGNYEQLLCITQDAWKQAKTRKDAIDLLPLVNKLIPL